MAKKDNSSYILDNALFTPWQIIIFALSFASIGGLFVIGTFAAPHNVRSFAIARQSPGVVEFSASTPPDVTDNLAVTNNCYTAASTLVSSQTAVVNGYITDKSVGRVGFVTFNVQPRLKCFAYVHKSTDSKSLADFSYVSM